MSDTSELEQVLRDERTQRYAVEQRLVQETDKARMWRRRAEERAARIQALEAQKERGSRRGRWRRRRTPGVEVPSPRAAAAVGSGTQICLLPVVRAAVAAHHPELRRCVDMMTVLELDSSPDALHDSDVVVIEADHWPSLPAAARRAVIEWSSMPARQRLVLWTAGGRLSDLGPLEDVADVISATSAEGAARLHGGSQGTVVLPPTFDPRVHNPRVGPERGGGSADEGGRQLVVDSAALAAPSGELIITAAAGLPVMLGAAAEDAFARAKAGVAARRWAYRYHAPWVRAAHLLDSAGVSHPRPLPTVAGIVVSKRPLLIEGVVRMLAAQTYPDTEVVVGVHGHDPAPVVEMMNRLNLSMRWQVYGFGEEVTLGECLNAAIDATGAGVLAKVDDDDHYGPAYLEDAIHALVYSGAGIVGKAAQYTYLQQEDRTVLRRPGDEEKLIGGTPTGAGMVWRRSVWEKVRFPHRPRFVDRLFVAGARTMGEQVYANSRWEFRLFRSEAGHTYEASAAAFLAGAEEAWSGDRPQLVEVGDLDPR